VLNLSDIIFLRTAPHTCDLLPWWLRSKVAGVAY